MPPTITTLLLLQTACGIPRDEYGGLLWDIACERVFSCYDAELLETLGGVYGEDMEACQALDDDQEFGLVEGCTYDARVARDCLDALEAMDCEEYTNGGYPTLCDGVCG